MKTVKVSRILLVCWIAGIMTFCPPYVRRMFAVCQPTIRRIFAVCTPYIRRMSAVYSSYVQGRSQDVSLRGVSVRAKRAGYAWTFLGEQGESVKPASGEKFLVLTARKTSRCNLAIEISFVPFSQGTFNFSVLRGTQVDFLLINLLRPVPEATHLAEGIWEDKC